MLKEDFLDGARSTGIGNKAKQHRRRSWAGSRLAIAHGRQGHETSAMRQPIPNPLMCRRYSRGTENEQEKTTEAGSGEFPPCGPHAAYEIVCRSRKRPYRQNKAAATAERPVLAQPCGMGEVAPFSWSGVGLG